MAELFYTEDHEWVEVEGDHNVRVGITEYAQEELGDIVYVELPEVGDQLNAGDELGTVESVKSVSEILAPVSGIVVAVNSDLEDQPELVNDDATGDGWFVEMETTDEVDTTNLLSKEQYENIIKD